VLDPDTDKATVLNGLTVEDCDMINVTMGFGTNWFYFSAPIPRNRVRNVTIRDVQATRVAAGGLDLHSVRGVVVERFRSHQASGLGLPFWWGTTGAIIDSCQDVFIINSEFAETDRMWPDLTRGDGCGVDIDGNNVNVTLRDCVFRDNDAPGLLFLSTFGSNTFVTIEDSTFYNNGLDAATSFGGNAYEIKQALGTLTSPNVFHNLGLYRSAPSWDWTLIENPGAITMTDIRYQYYSDVADRPRGWHFNADGNPEGWGSASQWSGLAVADGRLTGTSTGSDPNILSSTAWVNRHQYPRLLVRMSVTAGTTGKVHWVSETDPVWDAAKSVSFPVVADGQMRTYEIDLRKNPEYTGVITRCRLHPTNASGAAMAVDFVFYLGSDEDMDSDGDGLTDAEEAALGTNPYLYDTDGDGFNDGMEVAAGTDPLNPSSNAPLVTVHVNFSYTGPERGTLSQPMRTVEGAVRVASEGGTITMAAGSSSEKPRILTPVRLVASGGPVRIGDPASAGGGAPMEPELVTASQTAVSAGQEGASGHESSTNAQFASDTQDTLGPEEAVHAPHGAGLDPALRGVPVPLYPLWGAVALLAASLASLRRRPSG
jgi:hypothetical protein